MARKASLKESTAVMAPADEGTNGSTDTSEGRKRVITYTWNEDTGCIDQAREKSVTQSFRIADLNDDIRERALRHGLIQKLADSHAGKIPEAEQNAKETWDHLVAGDWYAARGESTERTSLFLEAYVMVMNNRGHSLTVEEFRKRVNDIESGDDDTKKKALRAARDNVDVQKAMNTIRMERLNARAEKVQQPELAML